MRRIVSVIPGDGIGPEVINAALEVIKASGADIVPEVVVAGTYALDNFGDPLPTATIESIKRNKIALKGPLATPIGHGYSSVNVELRKLFDLYVNIRPIKSFVGVNTRYQNVDLVIFRENTQELYTGKEEYIYDPKNSKTIVGARLTAEMTIANSLAFFDRVLQFAIKDKRKKITVGHKGNILKLLHGYAFLEQAMRFRTQSQNSGIEFDSRILDVLMMQLVQDPSKFDVIAVPNFAGDLLSDMCAGFIGGLGFAPGANLGDDCAIFEAVHGTAPDIAGRGIANPTAVILSAAMMLEYLGLQREANVIRWAVEEVIEEGTNVTRDLNPRGVSTSVMKSAIIDKMEDYFDLFAEQCC